MNKLIAIVSVLAFLSPVAASADSLVTATPGANTFISPSGVTNVAAGVTQTFNVLTTGGYKLDNVSFDGVSLGAQSSVDFTGIALDGVEHTISSSAVSAGGTMNYCSGPSAPGWNVSLPGGGCGGDETFLRPGESGVFNGAPYTCPDFYVSGCMLPR